MAAGNYSLTAVATDNTGAKTTSAGVTVTVAPPPNKPPTVSISTPAAGTTYTAPASMSVSATASDPDGSVVRVDFYAGTQVVGSDTSSPFSVTWSGVAAGAYNLTALRLIMRVPRRTSPAVSINVAIPLGTTVLVTPPVDYDDERHLAEHRTSARRRRSDRLARSDEESSANLQSSLVKSRSISPRLVDSAAHGTPTTPSSSALGQHGSTKSAPSAMFTK